MQRVPLLIVTFLVGCGGEQMHASLSYTVVDSAGVEIVESLEPAWGEGKYRIDSVPSTLIGREEEGPYQFGFLFQALFAEDGTIVVPEPISQEIRLFDSTGHHLRTLGGRGEGPGEFRRLTSVYRYLGDSLVAFDGQLFRVSILPRSGAGSRAMLSQVEGNYAGFGALGDGRFLLYSPGGSYHPELPPGLQWVRTDIIAVEPSDGAWQAIATLPGRQQLVESDGNTGLVIPPLYSVQAVAKDGFYWATPDRYEIGFYDGKGTLRRIMRRPVQPTAVDRSMIEEWIEANLDHVRQREGEGAVPRYRSRYEDALFGEHVPFFSTAFVDADGRLWMSGPTWPSLEEAPRHWSVFSDRGFWLGDLEAPERVRIVDSRGDLVLGIWRDDLDVPHVQVHRLVGIG